MSKRCLVDTNVLLRFLTGEPPQLAHRARAIVARADSGTLELEIAPLVLAETIFTLLSFYELPKADICNHLIAFLQSRGVIADALLISALERYRSHPVHFVDAYLAEAALARQLPICSFDRDFSRFSDVTVVDSDS